MLRQSKLGWFIILASLGHSRGQNSSVESPDLVLYDQEVATTSIVTYDKQNTSADEIAQMEKSLAETCNCRVEHLSSIGSFILHHQDISNREASERSLLEVRGVQTLSDNGIISLPVDERSADDKSLENDGMDNDGEELPNDTFFNRQWALGKNDNGADINWQEGRDKYMEDHGDGGDDGGDGVGARQSPKPPVIVAVIDSGVTYDHVDLVGSMWTNPGEIPGDGIDNDNNGIVDDFYGANFATNNASLAGDPMDVGGGSLVDGHGSHCAGVINAATDNGEGVAGVAGMTEPGRIQLMAVKIFGGQNTTFARMLRGINYAISMGAQVSSNSWGSNKDFNVPQQLIDALTNALKNAPHHLFVAASGNDNLILTPESKHMTCSVTAANHICVASSTKENTKSGFSNTGKQLVDLFAPGSDIMSTYLRLGVNRTMNFYSTMSGTSMACPHVSGMAAILYAIKPELTAVEVKDLILTNVQKRTQYRDMVASGGLLDVFKTIANIDKKPTAGLL